MWSPEICAVWARWGRLAPAFAVAALVAGCFQPMYGQLSPTGGPGIRDVLSGVRVTTIEAPKGTTEERLAVELRNELLFGFTGGAGSSSPTHELTVRLVSQNAKVIVDITSARPELENFGLDASYRLTEVATGKTVVTGTTSAAKCSASHGCAACATPRPAPPK